MSVTARAKPAAACSLEDLAAEVAQLRADNHLLALGLAKALVTVAPGHAPATFRAIVTQILRVYTHEQAERIEQIITSGG